MEGGSGPGAGPGASWCFLTFRPRGREQQLVTVQAELPADFTHFSNLVQRGTTFILSQSRLNQLNRECVGYFQQDISPSFYHVAKPKAPYKYFTSTR